MSLTEQQVIQKWSNRQGPFNEVDIYKLCKDLIYIRGGGDFVELDAPPGYEYDGLLVTPGSKRAAHKDGVWIHSVRKAKELAEQRNWHDQGDIISSSILVERTHNRGHERYEVYTVPEAINVPLIGAIIQQEGRIHLRLEDQQRSVLFKGVRAAWLLTVMAEQPPRV